MNTLAGHQHEFILFDESGDPLDDRLDSEACFRGCRTCGHIEVNPLSFHDDASLDNYLSMREIGGSSAERRVAGYLEEAMSTRSQEGNRP